MSPRRRTSIVLDAVKEGKITREEADAYLRAECGRTYEQAVRGQKRAYTAGIALAVLLLVGIVALLGGGPTGLVTLEPKNATDGTVTIPQATGLNVTGMLRGEGNATIYLDTPNGSLLVGRITSDDGTPRTARPAYSPGENITLEHVTADASYYFDDGSGSIAVELPLAASVNGTLLVILNESGSLRTHTLPIIIGDAPRTTAFNGLCEQTCAMDATNGTLRIETTDGAAADITRVEYAAAVPNRAPQLAVAFAPQLIEDRTSLELDGHFIDQDGDELLYTTSDDDYVIASVNGSTLSITPVRSGMTTLTIYASDLKELVQATIEINASAPVLDAANETNLTVPNATPDQNSTNDTAMNGTAAANSTPNSSMIEPTNLTLNETPINQTPANETQSNASALPNVTAPAGLDCSNPDPNARPEDCLNANGTYFDESIWWEDKDRAPAARFTQIGNLLLTGRVRERSTGAPGPRDFALGSTADFAFTPTIWIDSTTGDLHLRGELHEENANLQPSPGSYAVINRRGVYMAHADLTTGDLYLRGNAIPYREDINE